MFEPAVFESAAFESAAFESAAFESAAWSAAVQKNATLAETLGYCCKIMPHRFVLWLTRQKLEHLTIQR